uniref:Uncharacterized protein n=1 Tax=Arundo donax TaxID=35708 RepID=A0A0A9CU65_ARUDO
MSNMLCIKLKAATCCRLLLPCTSILFVVNFTYANVLLASDLTLQQTGNDIEVHLEVSSTTNCIGRSLCDLCTAATSVHPLQYLFLYFCHALNLNL